MTAHHFHVKSIGSTIGRPTQCTPFAAIAKLKLTAELTVVVVSELGRRKC